MIQLRDTGKIAGKFTQFEFLQAIQLYLSSNYNRILKPLLDKKHIYARKHIYSSQKQAVNEYMRYLAKEYL